MTYKLKNVMIQRVHVVYCDYDDDDDDDGDDVEHDGLVIQMMEFRE